MLGAKQIFRKYVACLQESAAWLSAHRCLLPLDNFRADIPLVDKLHAVTMGKNLGLLRVFNMFVLFF